jgi:hypothetical protein
VFETLEADGADPGGRLPAPLLAFLREEPLVGPAARHYL